MPTFIVEPLRRKPGKDDKHKPRTVTINPASDAVKRLLVAADVARKPSPVAAEDHRRGQKP